MPKINLEIPGPITIKEIEIEFPIYLKYDGIDVGNWEDYVDITKLNEDGEYLKLCIHKFFGKPEEYTIVEGNSYPIKLNSEYFEGKNGYSIANRAEFVEIWNDIKRIIDAWGEES
jgi:hypothetical protein